MSPTRGARHASLDSRRARALEVARRLARDYADARCALTHRSPLELLVATILSAQCTDERVNRVTPRLFAKYRSAADYAASPPGELESDIRSTGFFNNKARNLRGCGRALAERHDGRVPRSMAELLELPGVARKTANVVLGTAFGDAQGVVVDTHVTRITRLLGLTKETNAEKIERDLIELLPATEWIDFSHRLIWHGRKVCVARRPQCQHCGLADLCPSASKGAATEGNQRAAAKRPARQSPSSSR